MSWHDGLKKVIAIAGAGIMIGNGALKLLNALNGKYDDDDLNCENDNEDELFSDSDGSNDDD